MNIFPLQMLIFVLDHQILCYDLRYPSIPLYTYQGHQKAVSYVKWLNDNELLSA